MASENTRLTKQFVEILKRFDKDGKPVGEAGLTTSGLHHTGFNIAFLFFIRWHALCYC